MAIEYADSTRERPVALLVEVRARRAAAGRRILEERRRRVAGGSSPAALTPREVALVGEAHAAYGSNL